MPLTSTTALRLEDAYRRTVAREITSSVTDARFAILSDLHRGRGDGADDFLPCCETALAALQHYYDRDHALVLLGDTEELWEVPKDAWDQIFDHYREHYDLEAKFAAKEDQYFRVYGNHDLAWSRPTDVGLHLAPLIGTDLIPEALRITLENGGGRVGELFLVHGHQGDRFSDQLSSVSEFAVREAWARLQKATRFRSTRFEGSTELSGGRNEQIYFDWAVTKTGVLTIMGHTHRMAFEPVEGQSHPARTRRRIERHRNRARNTTSIELKQANERAARLWQERYERALTRQPGQDHFRPAYLNTGCGAYDNGHISAIEVADGRISLVTWAPSPGGVRRSEQSSAAITDIFRLLAEPSVTPDYWETVEPADFEDD